MKKLINHKLSITFFALIAVMLFVVGCSDNSVVNPEQQKKGPTFFTRISALHKDPVTVGAWIGPSGGTVGGSETYGNSISVPAGAVAQNTYFTVAVTNPSVSIAEFGPGGQFNQDITVTFSYDGFNVTSPSSIKVYWENPDTGWELVTDSPGVDTNAKTVTFSTGHFSKYGIGDDGG